MPGHGIFETGSGDLRAGRESLFAFDPQAMDEMEKYLEGVSAQWDQALSRLKSFVED